jgi:hypothetical protein
MLDVAARIRAAAVDPELRAAAAERWAEIAPGLFDAANHERKPGTLRISDAGQCVRKLWHLARGEEEKFSPEVQLDNLDNGTLIGAWRMCLLAASLADEGYYVELEPEVEHDGTPGHIDLYYRYLGYQVNEQGVVEHKVTMWPRALTDPEQRARYQCLQAAKYAAAKGVEDFAIMTSGPASPDKLRVDWFRLGDWQHALIGEGLRLQAALGPVEPEGDPDAPWRCRGCLVKQCPKNPDFQPDVSEQLKASLHA